MLKDFKNPHLVFVATFSAFVVALFLVDQRAAAILIGSLLAFMTDPSLAIVGIVLGLLGRNYKQFCFIAYPSAIVVSALTTFFIVSSWQQKVSGHEVELWVYILRAFAIIITAHIVQLIKLEIQKRKLIK